MIHFMLDHGDQLVNTLGAEINQIEDSLKVQSLPILWVSFYCLFHDDLVLSVDRFVHFYC